MNYLQTRLYELHDEYSKKEIPEIVFEIFWSLIGFLFFMMIFEWPAQNIIFWILGVFLSKMFLEPFIKRQFK